jgi:hypothetical protein
MSDFNFDILTSRPTPAKLPNEEPQEKSTQPKVKKAKLAAKRPPLKPATIIARDQDERSASLARLRRKKENFQARLVKRTAESNYDKQPVTVENSRLTWTFNLQPYPRSFGGQGFAKESQFVNLKDKSFDDKFQALWDEHLTGFHRKAFTKARKREFQKDMLWKEQRMAVEAESSTVKPVKGPKGPARVGKKKRKR